MKGRTYRQTRRAKASTETRERIVDAAIRLHMTVGPARTTISAIAEQAGVERLTVYRHFPREELLFRACVTQGWESFPPPDHRAWAKIADPERRLQTALTELYGYYGSVGDALAVIVRDFPHVPTLAALNAPHLAKWEEMRDVLARGWNRRGRQPASAPGSARAQPRPLDLGVARAEARAASGGRRRASDQAGPLRLTDAERRRRADAFVTLFGPGSGVLIPRAAVPACGAAVCRSRRTHPVPVRRLRPGGARP